VRSSSCFDDLATGSIQEQQKVPCCSKVKQDAFYDVALRGTIDRAAFQILLFLIPSIKPRGALATVPDDVIAAVQGLGWGALQPLSSSVLIVIHLITALGTYISMLSIVSSVVVHAPQHETQSRFP
jgi:hypothetical protein